MSLSLPLHFSFTKHVFPSIHLLREFHTPTPRFGLTTSQQNNMTFTARCKRNGNKNSACSPHISLLPEAKPIHYSVQYSYAFKDYFSPHNYLKDAALGLGVADSGEPTEQGGEYGVGVYVVVKARGLKHIENTFGNGCVISFIHRR